MSVVAFLNAALVTNCVGFSGPTGTIFGGWATALPPPSHLYPAAQVVQYSRRVLVPPPVLDPAAHTSHLVCPVLAAYFLSSPQSAHAVPPVLAYVPLGHTVTVLDPSHEEPVRHVLHLLRVLTVFSDVNEPAAHAVHLSAPALL